MHLFFNIKKKISNTGMFRFNFITFSYFMNTNVLEAGGEDFSVCGLVDNFFYAWLILCQFTFWFKYCRRSRYIGNLGIKWLFFLY